MTTEPDPHAVAVFNRTLAADVTVTSADDFRNFWSNVTSLNKGVAELDETAFSQLIAKLAFGGIPETVEDALNKLMDLEAAASEAEGIKRVRKARAGVADTEYVVPNTFRGYKKILRDALVNGVELLSGQGYPLTKAQVLDALKALKSSDKPAIEKLLGCADTFLKILAKCDGPVDKAQVEAIKAMLDTGVDNWLATA
jgi:hypothetical protein